MDLAARLSAERDRWVLWVPVGLASGIGIYFALPVEPQFWLGPGLTLLFLVIAVIARRRSHPVAGIIAALAVAGLIVALGLALAQIETWRMAAPVLDHKLTTATVEGSVVDVETVETGARITLAPSRISGLVALPRLIRIKLRAGPVLRVGDHLQVRATLQPPPPPALPGGFDFQRQAYFRGLGAVGYALGQPVITPGSPDGASGWIRALRDGMTRRIRAALPVETGAIAAALITGERGQVPPAINQDYRDSGLAHLLVIAGLHMTLVTGFVFFAMRAVLALIPPLALRYPIKKWSALAALLVVCLYLVISGAAVPTQRAFVMVALGLLALLVDRKRPVLAE